MKNTADLRLARPRPDAKKFLRVAGLPAVAAVFATAPGGWRSSSSIRGARSLVGAFCAVLARARKPYRLVGSEELARVAGTILHGGVVALTQPRPMSPFDPDKAAAWARDGRLLLLLDGVGNPHNFGAIARTAAFFGLPRIVLSDHRAAAFAVRRELPRRRGRPRICRALSRGALRPGS
jgi:TrmH RNA methyltransferase